ncbi:TerD-family protein [Streptomyces caatingaensis]|uniref:TerD-family protein n=1 Tax=Streptomyces caatingaensis TaxID=1678637 RepID=A0A0K9XIN2_9ACTN|nr:TerD-family protein [Streptomyces caatingaensis]
MGVPLTKGGNVSLSRQVPGLTAVTVQLGWQAGAGYDLDASALLCGGSGKVLSDRHFVFFNNLTSPDGSVRHEGSGGDGERIQVNLAAVPADVEKVVFPVSLYEAEQRRQSFGQVRAAFVRVLNQADGREIARYDLAPDGLGGETALVFGELYRHGAEWKFRAVGQGYASGLAGIATDYGVDVLRETPGTAPAAPAPAPQDMRKAAAAPEFAAPAAPVPSAPPATPAAPAPTPTVVMPQPPAVAAAPPVPCFFDPGHGPGAMTVTYSPQWGAPRPVQACGGCAQRVQTTVPPFYAQPVQGQPVVAQPQQGQGYPDPQPRRQGPGWGGVAAAGAAGLVGGALLNEAFDD